LEFSKVGAYGAIKYSTIARQNDRKRFLWFTPKNTQPNEAGSHKPHFYYASFLVDKCRKIIIGSVLFTSLNLLKSAVVRLSLSTKN